MLLFRRSCHFWSICSHHCSLITNARYLLTSKFCSNTIIINLRKTMGRFCGKFCVFLFLEVYILFLLCSVCFWCCIMHLSELLRLSPAPPTYTCSLLPLGQLPHLTSSDPAYLVSQTSLICRLPLSSIHCMLLLCMFCLILLAYQSVFLLLKHCFLRPCSIPSQGSNLSWTNSWKYLNFN